MSAHANWQSVLAELKSFPKNDGNYYLIAQGKGTSNETRSRFMTYNEALVMVLYEIEKNKGSKVNV